MRIAACLSGHSRNYKQNFPNFPFEVEYFISSCMESGLPSEDTNFFVSYHSQNNVKTSTANIEDIVNLYQPRVFEFLPDTELPEKMLRYTERKTIKGAYLQHIGMMFYRIYRANQLKKQHELQYNFRYDFVIRSRFDVKVMEFNFNENYLYLLAEKNKVIDLFFAGKSYIMDALSECYLWFVEQDPEYLQTFDNAEHILSFYVEQLKLNMPMLNTFFINFNKDYPHQVNIIKNGITQQYSHGKLFYFDEWKQ